MARNFIFDAGGTGFSRQRAADLINQPSRDQYLSELGDEVMLLDGLADYPVGYDTGEAAAYSLPWNEESYDFGIDGFMFGEFSLGSHVGGHRGFSGMGDLGDAAQDRMIATSAANVSKGVCDTGCRIGFARADQATQLAQCLAGCQGAYSAAIEVINAATALPPGTQTSPADRAAIDAKMRQFQQESQMTRTGQMPIVQEDNTMVYVAVGVGVLAALGIGAYFVMRNR